MVTRDNFHRHGQEGSTNGLPTGTLTLLFTDIEGSTQLLDALGSRYGDLLHDHHGLILSSIEEHGGSLVDTQGDGSFIVFPTADDAVAAAVTAQRGLAAHPWPDGVTVRVRMGVHTGSPVRMDERYVGMDVHRAARIMSVARGGQVIASATTVELSSVADVGWIDLGRYRLKDLKRPEHLFQLKAPGLGEDFDPPSVPRWAVDLPEPPTRFIGRMSDVAALDEMLGRSDLRLVTLMGPGGIGKTRLAIRVADRAASRFRDGVVFVPLASVTEAYEMVGAIAAAAGSEPGDNYPVTLNEQLRDQELLLILDNLEHLPAAAPMVSELVKECRQVRVLATSRAPLGIHGENLYPVRPLEISDGDSKSAEAPFSDAIALFVDRARSIDPSFEITAANVATVEEICRRADGIPLAIELAAVRIATMSPRELLDRLTIDTLRGPADVDERQQTLRSTIDWSYRLLSAGDRETFRRLSVFAGGASLGAIEAVIDPESRLRILERVETLVRQSLMWRDEDRDGTSRFHMLGTVREFAQDELVRAGERTEFSNRHASYLLSFVATANQHIDGADAEVWLARVEAEMPNLRAALHWTLEENGGSTDVGVELVNAMGWFWYVRGDPTDGRRWLELALAVAADTSLELRVRLVYYSAALLERLGRLGDAETRFEEALVTFRELSDQQRVAQTLNSLGGLAVDRGDSVAAFQRLEEAERTLRAQGDDYGLAVSLVNLCDAALATGDHDLADRYGREGLELFTGLENEWGVAIARRHLAKVAHARGDYPEARVLLLQALRGSHGLGDRQASVRCLERLAGVEIRLGSPRRGLRLAAAALKLREEIGDRLTAERHESFKRSWADARLALGDAEFEEAWAQGAQMTFDQAAEYALADGAS